MRYTTCVRKHQYWRDYCSHVTFKVSFSSLTFFPSTSLLLQASLILLVCYFSILLNKGRRWGTLTEFHCVSINNPVTQISLSLRWDLNRRRHYFIRKREASDQATAQRAGTKNWILTVISCCVFLRRWLVAPQVKQNLVTLEPRTVSTYLEGWEKIKVLLLLSIKWKSHVIQISVSVNKFYWKHSHTHWFTYWLWLLLP